MKNPEYMKAARELSGLSVSALAKALGVSRLTVYRWESGQAAPTEKLLTAFEIVTKTGRPPELETAGDPLELFRLFLEYRGRAAHRRISPVHEHLRVSRQTVNRWQTGKSTPSEKTLQLIKNILDTENSTC